MIAIRGATMNTRRITVDLPNASYRNLRRLVESGQYASESEALAEVLLDVGLEPAHAPGDPEFDRWMREEVLVADDELEADPSAGLTPEQLHAELAAARLARLQSR
jgi:antitoxin ParD1/3/4